PWADRAVLAKLIDAVRAGDVLVISTGWDARSRTIGWQRLQSHRRLSKAILPYNRRNPDEGGPTFLGGTFFDEERARDCCERVSVVSEGISRHETPKSLAARHSAPPVAPHASSLVSSIVKTTP